MQASVDDLHERAEIYVINSDTPEQSLQLRQISGTTLPVLLDPELSVARSYDFLPKSGQPMGDMAGVAQMGFVVIDGDGVIRVQRADINFGDHAGQIATILDIVTAPTGV